jgi:tetratricopeptide (TPR) repeat protein
MLNAAIAAFKQADYDSALDITNRAITQFPSDAVLHEFRALVLFAKGDYRQSAATLHSVLALGPGWDWTTMARLYPDISLYTTQLRTLEDSVRQNPQDAAGHFVLAYHYMTAGHADSAANQLAQVTQLVSNDRVAADLLRMLKTPQTAASSPGAPGPTPKPPVEEPSAVGPGAVSNAEMPSVDPKMLVGSWKASRDDGSQFELTLTGEQDFRWKFTASKQKPQELSGKYTVEHNVLALQQKSGGALIGQVALKGTGPFNFKMLGGPQEDPGLDFSKR